MRSSLIFVITLIGEYIQAKLGEENTLDPMRRDYRGREMECVEEIVEGDKLDIDISTHILVIYDRPSVGTSMEVLYAWERKKPVIVVASLDTKLVRGEYIIVKKYSILFLML